MKMIIHNFSQLNKGRAQSKALQILNAGLESAMPQKKIEKIVNKKEIKFGNRKIMILSI